MNKQLTSDLINCFDNLPDCALINLFILCNILSCSPATVWRRVKDGKMPSPIKVGIRTTRWRVGDIRLYLANLK